MSKKSKLQTPEWILKGGEKPKEKKIKEKNFKIRECPKCGSNEVGVILKGEEGKRADEWECKKCKWKGKNINGKQVSENEFLEMINKIN